MNNSDKIKAIQHKAGLKVDGIVSLKTWIGIYDLLFETLPIHTSETELIKAVQQKLKIKANGKAGAKTLDLAYKAIFGKEIRNSLVEVHSETKPETGDTYNETILEKMPREVAPFAKELIHIAANQGICLRLIGTANEKEESQKAKKHQLSRHIFMDAQSNFSNCNFGLAFDIGIFEKTSTGELIFKDQSPLYAKVAQLGESIGLTCATSNKSNITQVPHFELRPAWAVRMKESEMIKELYRRKKENINLLAFI